jgi:hypothetical protein
LKIKGRNAGRKFGKFAIEKAVLEIAYENENADDSSHSSCRSGRAHARRQAYFRQLIAIPVFWCYDIKFQQAIR